MIDDDEMCIVNKSVTVDFPLPIVLFYYFTCFFALQLKENEMQFVEE